MIERIWMFTKQTYHVLIIIFVGVIIYSNSLFVPFQFDDPINIELNPFVRDQLPYSQYKDYCLNIDRSQLERNICNFTLARYIGYLTFAWNYWIGGTDVLGYHIVNVLVHVVNALLVYLVVVLTFKTPFLSTSRFREKSHAIAFLSAFFFLAHPIQTQAVTYIVQRLTSLATLFYLISLAGYIKWRLRYYSLQDEGQASLRRRYANRRGHLFWYFVSLLSTLLAMKTKEIAFTLPVMLALYEFLFFSDMVKKRIVFLLPFLLTMLVIPVSIIMINKPDAGMFDGISDSTRVLSSMTRWEYFLTELRVIVTYLRLIALPINQNLDYDYPIFRSLFDVEVALSCLLIAVTAGLAVFSYRRSKRGEGSLRLLSFGIAWFFVTLMVESSVIPIVDVIFEHRIYLPSAGVFLSAGVLVAMLLESIEKGGGAVRITLQGILLVVMMVLPCASYARNMVWKDEIVLWEDVIRKSPYKARGYVFLSNAYDKRGDRDKAMRLLDTALRIEPSNAIANSKMGILYAAVGNYRKALEFYDRAETFDPDLANNHFARANLHAEIGQYDKALEGYEKTLQINPMHSQAYNNRGNIFLLRNAYHDAIANYDNALSTDPTNVDAHINRGMAYSALKKYDKAIADYKAALEFSPGNAGALFNRGAVYFAQGSYQLAIDDYAQVIMMNPFLSDGYLRRGKAYLALGRTREAAADFQKACDLGGKEGCFQGKRTVIKGY